MTADRPSGTYDPKPADKGYWDSRQLRPSRMAQLKGHPFWRRVFSVRSTDEIYFEEMLTGGGFQILDVACGAGQAQLVRYGSVTGIDIPGFPRDMAREKGYTKAVEWAPDFGIPTADTFDVATIINLNAHVPAQTLEAIVRAVQERVRPGGRLLFVNEYDNDNVAFRWMKRQPEAFDAWVNCCEHFHFHYEGAFTRMMEDQDGLRHISSRVLAANPPALHIAASRGIGLSDDPLPSSVLAGFTLADLLISQVNNLSSPETGFLVGHAYAVS